MFTVYTQPLALPRERSSGAKQLLRYLSGHVGETKVTAHVAIGEPGVI